MSSVACRYRLTRGGPRSTEALVEAGTYGYAHSCVTSENFPVRSAAAAARSDCDVVLLAFDRDVNAAEVLAEAARLGLERPTYEDALHFGVEHPAVQQAHPVVFLHDPWVGYFGRRDVLCLWSNAGRRELGLEGFDDTWSPAHRFAFLTAVGAPSATRPFYGEFAWAYDYLVARPVADECAGMAAMLARRGIGPGARLLDAGCGNGRYAVELARLGFVVTGVDRSPALLDEARARLGEAGGAVAVRLEAGDLLALPAGPRFDAVVCRGVLNDVVEAEARAAVLAAFARVLRPGGVLLLDVRDWEATVAGKTGHSVSEKRVATPRGGLVFRSETRLDPATRRMHIAECHTLTTEVGATTSARYDFVMGCWTRDEPDAGLRRAGFAAAEYADAYDGAPLGHGDRIVVAASRAVHAEGSA